MKYIFFFLNVQLTYESCCPHARLMVSSRISSVETHEATAATVLLGETRAQEDENHQNTKQ